MSSPNEWGISPVTSEGMREAIDTLRNTMSDNVNYQINRIMTDTMLTGVGMTHIVYDEAAHVSTTELFERPLDELHLAQVMMNGTERDMTICRESDLNFTAWSVMSDDEVTMTNDRSSFYDEPHTRRGRARAMMTPLERDASMERLEMTRGCGDDCDSPHSTDCLMCGENWWSHSGHRCPRSGDGRGSFPIGGR